MAYYLNKEQLNEARKSTRFYSSLNESKVALERRAFSYEVTVFLSHHHGDGVVLENVISELKRLGVNVYVDWNDAGMPARTSGVTATRIKDKIRTCKKFILLATEAAIASKWCNWELGYGDAYRYKKDIAIMPIKDSANKYFSGSEYLQIYSVITNQYENTLGTYYVDDSGVIMTLEDWLKR